MESSETIRAHAIDFFLENGADPTAGMQEVIVVDDGCYSGRHFFCAELQVIWSPQTGILSLIDDKAETTEISIKNEVTTANAA